MSQMVTMALLGFHTSTTTAVTQMGNNSETEGMGVNTPNNREKDAERNETSARRDLLNESDGLFSFPTGHPPFTPPLRERYISWQVLVPDETVI